MIPLANLDQALKEVLDCTDRELNPHPRASMLDGYVTKATALEAMRRAYRLAEAKEELGRMLGEPPADAGLKEARRPIGSETVDETGRWASGSGGASPFTPNGIGGGGGSGPPASSVAHGTNGRPPK